MLELLRMDLVYFLALASLLIMLFGPVAAVWIALSIRRDIHRIADALERTNSAELTAAQDHWVAAINESAPPKPGIANSAFGR